MDSLIHFWCPDPIAQGVDSWNPDAEPQRFASAVGHGLFELFVRLRAAGACVELGDTPSREPHLVVASAALLWRSRSAAAGALRAVAGARDRFVLIRGDVPLWWHLPIKPVVEVMPNRLVSRAANQLWLAPLPQRGMLRRAGGPVERIRTVGLKCNPENLPPELREPALGDALRTLGVELRLDVPTRTDGSDQHWHDFSEIDAVLCTRSGPAHDLLRKPATKLINSWVAGCIPIATPEPSYAELATDGEDVCFVDALAELPGLLERVNSSAARLDRLDRGIAARRAEFEPQRVLGRWRQMLEEAADTAPARTSHVTYARSGRSRASVALWGLRAFHHGARWRSRLRRPKDAALLRELAHYRRSREAAPR